MEAREVLAGAKSVLTLEGMEESEPVWTKWQWGDGLLRERELEDTMTARE
jgi:hypothetical protein